MSTSDLPARSDALAARHRAERRSRADTTRTELLGAADAVLNAPPETFATAVSQYLDLDRYITFYAVEAVTSNYDGFSFNVNNAYLYAHPRDGRLITIP